MTADTAAALASAYATTGAAVELGAVVVDGSAHPDAGVRLPLSTLNRHGLVAGATGTGKTKTVQLLAEQLSAAGVPVFLADVKGDLSGLGAPGTGDERVTRRAAETATDWQPQAFPCEFLALGGIGDGVPVRATVTAFGPTLLSKVLRLNRTQESSLGLVFAFADRAGLPLLDLKDLRAVITHLTSDAGAADLAALGGLAKATAGVILRELVALEAAGGDVFFGEPEFDTADLLRTTPDGRGVLSVMQLRELQDRPQLFSTFLVWLLADLFQDLPEVGDPERPELVFFLDEAHLLFDDASEAFLDAIGRTVRLIRSKGVGVFFVTQSPEDLPDEVLGQLGNRVQHALRAFTADDARGLKAAARTYPRSEVYDLEELLTSLGTGEAAVTILSEGGAPTPVAWTRLRPPASRMAPLDAEEMRAAVQASELLDEYGTPVDRDSAYERLLARVAPPVAESRERAGAAREVDAGPIDAGTGPEPRRGEPRRGSGGERGAAERGTGGRRGSGESFGAGVFRSFARAAASAAGREIVRSLFGTASRRGSAPRRRSSGRRRRATW